MKLDTSRTYSVLPTFSLAALAELTPSAHPSAPAEMAERTPSGIVIPFKGFVCAGKGDCHGVADPERVMAALDSALKRWPGERITLDIDSPGGCTKGVAELAAYIRAAVDRGAEIHAFTRGLCCSAAYWIASQCKSIVATRGAEVGNCGAYIVVETYANNDWVSSTLFSSGELKAAGHPDFPLTEAQREFFSAHVADIAELFFRDVVAARPGVDVAAMRSGGYWLADRARDCGLIDHVALDIPEQDN